MIKLDGVDLGYGRRPVVVDVQWRIAAGEFVAVLGPNGSGKTTLLRTLMGLMPPLKGRVQWGGEGIRPVLGYVPQQSSLDPGFLFSALEVVVMGTYQRVKPGRPVPARERAFARECLDRTGMGRLASHPFAELSGGQRQRVLIARALAVRPQVLVLDEPTTGLDVDAVEQVVGLLETLHREGHGVIMVNHDLDVVRRLVSSVLFLNRGRAVTGNFASVMQAWEGGAAARWGAGQEEGR